MMTPKQLKEFYTDSCKSLGKDSVPDLLDEKGKLRPIMLRCPMCSNSESEESSSRLGFSDDSMGFDFGEHTFFCAECDSTFTAKELLDELETKIAIFKDLLEGFALLFEKLPAKTGGFE